MYMHKQNEKQNKNKLDLANINKLLYQYQTWGLDVDEFYNQFITSPTHFRFTHTYSWF